MSEETSKYTPAQEAARKRQDEKRRKDKKRIPLIRLNEDEFQVVDEVFRLYGGKKKKAVLDGLALLRKQLKRSKP